MKLTKTTFKPNYNPYKKSHFFFLVFVFSKVLSICELLLACLKKCIISLTIAIYKRYAAFSSFNYKQVLASRKSFSIAEKHQCAVGRWVGYHVVAIMTTYYAVGKLWHPGTAF